MRRIIIAILLVVICWLPGYAQQPSPSDQYGFQAFWNTHGGQRLFGDALTEPLEENGRIVQYFEYARFEYAPEQPQSVVLGLLGVERTRWRTFAPQPTVSGNVLRVAGSQYVMRGVFRSFWEQHGGLSIFGLPISAQVWEQTAGGRYQVQYFERALMIHHPLRAGTPEEIVLAPLGREVAAAHSLIEGSVALNQPELFAFDPVPPAPLVTELPPKPPAPATAAAPQTAQRPNPPPAPTATPIPAPRTATKRIEVSLGDQWLYAFEGDTLVYDAPIATGKDGFNTPPGDFAIYAKTPLQTMRGSINGESWVVPNVPHAMYFNGSIALHGTYWHNLFGSGVRISHGCVNVPLAEAEWLYGWATIGTPVLVY